MPRVNATFIVDCFTTSLPTAPLLRHIYTLYSLRSRYGRKKLFIASRRRIMLAGLWNWTRLSRDNNAGDIDTSGQDDKRHKTCQVLNDIGGGGSLSSRIRDSSQQWYKLYYGPLVHLRQPIINVMTSSWRHGRCPTWHVATSTGDGHLVAGRFARA